MADDASRGALRFDADDVVQRYAAEEEGLSEAERDLVERWAPPTPRVLDLGIGTGRTVAGLHALGPGYVGVDVAPAMVEEARRRHPEADLRVLDASDLSSFEEARFDLVMWSYNGIDYLTDQGRTANLGECRRVLSTSGVLLVSSHDPRAVLVRPSRLPGPAPRRWALAAWMTLRRLGRALPTRAFWSGRGTIPEPLWKGMRTFAVTRRAMRADLARAGFDVVAVVPGDVPGRGRPGRTTWWYYAAVVRGGGKPSER